MGKRKFNIFLLYIESAIEGARYHEKQAFRLKGGHPNDYDLIIIHLRAYFWELWSIWDYALQYVNTLTLNLAPEKVRRNFLQIVQKEIPDFEHLEVLLSIQDDEKLARIMALRDHSHKWRINPYLIEQNDEGVQVIVLDNFDQKDSRLPKQINIDKNDLVFMENAIKQLTDSGLFN